MKSRRGMSLLASAVSFCVLGLAFGASQSLRTRHTTNWLARVRLEQAARDLASSALEEATHELMEAVNKPGDPAWTSLRGPGRDAKMLPALVETRRLLAGHPELELTRAEIEVVDAKPLHTSVPFEWAGTARVSVSIASRGQRLTVQGFQERELRAACIAPVPFDRLVRMDVTRPLSEVEPAIPLPAAELGITAPAVPQPLALWKARATLVVEPDASGSIQARFDVLRNRLGRLSGIVLVDNAGKAPLSLRGVRWAGQAIVVVTGAVEMADVRLADPATDLLSVIAFDGVSLDGVIEAAVVLTEPLEAPGRPKNRRAGPSTAIRGAYVVTAGPSPLDPKARVDPLETLVATDRSGTVRADRIFVSVSPQLAAHRITVL